MGTQLRTAVANTAAIMAANAVRKLYAVPGPAYVRKNAKKRNCERKKGLEVVEED